jgi:cbb3-type cytochrome oxidase subunit 3
MQMTTATVSGVPEPRAAAEATTPAARAVRTARLAAFLRRRGLREIGLIALVYGLYDASRFLVAGQQSTALHHAGRVLSLETDLDLNWEHALNQLVSAHRLLAVPADYIYATLHYVVTPAVLVWMWRRHHGHYGRARTTLIVATLIGLAGFTLMPVAPPRMLPGFVDTMARYSQVGWWGGDASAPRGLGGLTNQFAAMPSLHVGWALWCGWQLVNHGRRRLTRLLGVLYPTLITVVVVATGNHYLLDAVAGGAVVVLAVIFVRSVAWMLPGRRRAAAAAAPPLVIDLTDANADDASLLSRCG